VKIFVNGTLMRGLPLHENLCTARFLGEAATAPEYALFALGNGTYPGMIHIGPDPRAISVPGEIYDLPDSELPALLDKEPPHLYLGPVRLSDGSQIDGILCEVAATHSAVPISRFGGWRAYASRTRADSR